MISDKMLLDLMFEYGTERELAELATQTIANLDGLRNVYKIPGSWHFVKHTERRIKGHNPPCGGGKPFDPDMVDAGRNVMFASPILSGGVPILMAIEAAIGIALMFWGNSYQQESNCIVVTGLLPGRLDPDWVRDHLTVQYFLSDDWGEREVSPGEHNWAMLEAAVVPQDPYVDIPVSSTPRHDNERCTMTMVCAMFKNWSHTKSRRVRIDLICDAFPNQASTCADASVINRELYGRELVACIPYETKQRLIREYTDELLEDIAPA